MVTRIGCFHFAERHDDPFSALRKAIGEHGDVRGSLIVLPEAFNYGKGYNEKPPEAPRCQATRAVNELTALATTLRVVFVVGLLNPPYSSSYLVSSKGGRLISHKKTDDCSQTYVPCERECDVENPVQHDDACIGVLLCNEIQLYARTLTARVDESKCTRKIVCIPACMDAAWFGNGPLTYDYWKRKHVVLANSNPNGCGSFITNADGERDVYREQQNRIMLRILEDLEASTP